MNAPSIPHTAIPPKATRRAMVITTNFPPDASVGTMRTLRLVRHLADVGWHVDAVTLASERYRPGTVIDPTLLEKVPPSVHILRPAAWRPFERLAAAAKQRRARKAPPGSTAGAQPPSPAATIETERRSLVIRALRASLTIPDREASWFPPAVVASWRRGRRHAPDVIYSSGPPFTAHVVAAAVAGVLHRPWVADFRDPWARAPWRDDRFEFEKRAWRILERMVVNRAQAVLFVTDTNHRDFADYYGSDIASRFHVIPNGCDTSDFDGLVRQARTPNDPWVLLHAGSLYGARNPTPLFRAVASAIARGEIDRRHIRVRFVGRVGVTGLPAAVRELGLGDVVEFIDHMPRRAVLQQMLDASALLIVQPVTTVSIPAKLYEYLAARRPVLALAEPEGETAELVRRSGAGLTAPADDEAAIEHALLSLVACVHEPFDGVDRAIYDGAVRARQIERLLDDVAGRRSAALGADHVAQPTDARQITRS